MRHGSVQSRLPSALANAGPFRLLFVGQALSVIGDRVTPVAIAFAVLGIGTPTDLGIVLAAGGLPFALFAIVGGVWADRLGRREVMVASDVARAVSQALTASLLLSGQAEIWMLAVLSAVYGTSAAVFMPALTGLIPQTVRPQQLQEANALLSLTRSLANVAGPALAGVIIAAFGSGEAIAIDSATFAISALCLIRLRVEAPATASEGEASDGFAHRLREGWAEVRARAWLSWGLGAVSAYHVFVMPSVFVLGPTLASRELDGASSWAIIITCFGLGSIVGNLIALRVRLRRPVLVAALALVGASTQAAIIGSGMGTWGIAGVQLLAGVCVALFFTLWDLSIQEQVPSRAVSRVSSYDFTVTVGLMPIGMAIAGPIADAIGLQTTLRAMSAIGVLAALTWLAVPSVRRVERPQAAAAPADALSTEGGTAAVGGRELAASARGRSE